MPLSEHVYCVAVTFKMTEKVKQQICIKFCIKLEHSSMETIPMIQKASGDDEMSAPQVKVWQLVMGSFIMKTCLLMHHILCRDFGSTSNHPGDSAPLQPRFGALWLLACPKTKSPFQTIDETQENMTGQLMTIGRIV